MEKFIAVQM
jgi:hypothetical protein